MKSLKNNKDGNILLTVLVTLGLGTGLMTFSEQTQKGKAMHDKARGYELAKNINLSSVKLVEGLILSTKLSVIDRETGKINDRKAPGMKRTPIDPPFSNYTFLKNKKECQKINVIFTGQIKTPSLEDIQNMLAVALKHIDDTISDPDERARRKENLITAFQNGTFSEVVSALAQTDCSPWVQGNDLTPQQLKDLKAFMAFGVEHKNGFKMPKPSGKSNTFGFAPIEGTVIDLSFDVEKLKTLVTTRPDPSEIFADGNRQLFLDLRISPDEEEDLTFFQFNPHAKDEDNNPVGLFCAQTSSSLGIWNSSGDKSDLQKCNFTQKADTRNGVDEIKIDDVKNGMLTQTSIDFLEGRMIDNSLFAHITARTYYLEKTPENKTGSVKKVEDKYMVQIPNWEIPNIPVDIICSVEPNNPACCPKGNPNCDKPSTEKCVSDNPCDPDCPGYDAVKCVCDDECCLLNPSLCTKDQNRCSPYKTSNTTALYDTNSNKYEDIVEWLDARVKDKKGAYSQPATKQKVIRTNDKKENYTECGQWEQFRLVHEFYVESSENQTCNPNSADPNQCCHTEVIETYAKYYKRTKSCPPIVVVTCEEKCEDDGMGGKNCETLCDTNQCVYTGTHLGKAYCRMRGCFSLDTPLTLANGETRTYDTLMEKDLLLNPVTGKAVGIREIRIGPENKLPSYKVGYSNVEIHVSSLHPFPVRNIGGAELVKPAKRLLKTDSVLGEDGQYYRVSKLEEVPVDPNLMVYNVALDTDSDNPLDHFILANGIITGDLWLQRYLETYDGPMPVFLQGLIKHKPVAKSTFSREIP